LRRTDFGDNQIDANVFLLVRGFGSEGAARFRRCLWPAALRSLQVTSGWAVFRGTSNAQLPDGVIQERRQIPGPPTRHETLLWALIGDAISFQLL
jgi:hypothetical protein